MMQTTPMYRKSATVSWILYDLANTAYSMNIVSLYFATWIIVGLGQSDFWVSIVNSVSMVLVALTMPVLGEWSDRRAKKMPALFVFTMVCIIGTFLMGVLGKHIVNISILLPVLLVLYVLTNYSYQGGLVFYNALMPAVSTSKNMGRVSGYGVALGYFGSVTGLILARLFVEGSAFGLTIPGVQAGGRVAAFIPTAIFFFIFALPIFFFVKEPVPKFKEKAWSIVDSYKRIFRSIKDTQKHPGLLRFLIAKFFYEDAIQTVIIFMGAYTEKAMNFSSAESNMFFIVVIPAAIVGSALCGIFTDHYGPKKTLSVVVALWIISMIVVALTTNKTLFWLMGGFVGILLGSTWTSSRPLLVTLAPKENLGEYFGLYALSGKVAAIVGPLVWAAVTAIFLPYGDSFRFRAAIIALSVMVIIGFMILRRVPDFHKK